MRRRTIAVVSLLSLACSSPMDAGDTGSGTDTGVSRVDTGVPPVDTGMPVDGGTPPMDTGVPPMDTGVPPTDTGTPPVDTGAAPADTSPPPVDAAITSFGTPMAIGTTPGSGLPEISGIVSSRTHAGVFWVENDSGNPADVFAIDGTGALLATIHVMGATNRDWEDLTITRDPGGSGDVLYIAETGDNAARTSDGATGWPSVHLYRMPEPDPALGDQTLAAERIDLTYPVRPYDCEAVFADHATGDIYFVTKENTPAEIFVARAPLAAGASVMLEHVGTIDMSIATAADMSRDGTRIVVRGYGTIHVFSVLATGVADSLASTSFLTAMPGSSAEAICFAASGYDLYTIAEGDGATLYRIPAL